MLEIALGRALPSVLAALHVASPRSAAEVALRQLIATFYLRSAIPSLKVGLHQRFFMFIFGARTNPGSSQL